MEARQIAKHLTLHHLPVTNIVEPEMEAEGMVEITPTLHVQVPLVGYELCTVEQRPDGCFQFGEVRTRIIDVINDVRAILERAR